MEFIWFLLIGAVAGWLAGRLFSGRGFGFLGNMAVGILGSIAGGWLAGWLGISLGGGLVGQLLVAAGGAIVLLWFASLFKKKKR